mgnify:FL=1
MLELNSESIQSNAGAWGDIHVTLPAFDRSTVSAATMSHPVWVHFGSGNIFRGFIAVLQQRLLNEGFAKKGIIAAETFDSDIIEQIYRPFDDLTMMVTLNPDGTMDREVIGSVCESLKADGPNSEGRNRLRQIFREPGLQIASFTITEKGYALYDLDGELLPVVREDIEAGPSGARHTMSIAAALLYGRYQAGGYPMAMVSMDNCSHNGDKLRDGILTIATAWRDNKFVEDEFLAYLQNEDKIYFPWSMIDKITPRPHKTVESSLKRDGIKNMTPIVTSRSTFIAPFVNAERTQYLVIEDRFPNGRPALEKAGVFMTTRDIVDKAEKMKVNTCLNPLHTAMSVYGCLLGYTLVCDIMRDSDIVSLIRRFGYVEGLPVVVDPGILSPEKFLDEVMEQRLPNPSIPDTPQRITTDTSQVMSIRFGETIKSYIAQGRDPNTLISIPLTIAGWLRYLLAVDDAGKPMEVSSDPLKDELQMQLAGIELGKPDSYHGQIRPILANVGIFGLDLSRTPLLDTIETMFVEELTGPGAVRATLKKY